MTQRKAKRGTTASSAITFGEEIRFARDSMGYTQEDVGKLLHCDRTVVSRTEGGKRKPSIEEVEELDRLYGTGDLLKRLYGRVDWDAEIEHPVWFQEYVDQEAIAVGLRAYQDGTMYGLLQCPQYARALFATGEAAGNPEEIEELTRARLSRQSRFLVPDGPLLLVILDESAIRRVVGGPGVMRRQMERLLRVAQLRNVVIHVAPFSNQQTVIKTAMVLLELPDGQRLVYSESLERGHLSGDSASVVKHQRRYDQLRGECLSESDSLRLIAETLEGFRDEEQRARRSRLDEEQLQRQRRRQLHRGGPRVPRPRPRA
ncbi:helix-turn-helix domain-containing protein [Kitasatospora cathayae]|uniref:Helix-turn-helix transcriptional regulator n=1 Tax=Kitasatospora cathayae TaxID=3004092 RepID=A0ABY7QB73_9ACTN|nr:helix-turn-helix transcriptional regulator [Kitasatospora sp. HUAS 3-15]WBP89376.1 helix-turn-helix transcriptional regulator [Kitasatospora sp. HUAS 3-15]